MKLRHTRSVLLAMSILLVAASGGLVPQRALASGTDTWTGRGGDDNWSTPGNWDSGVPTNGMALNFPPFANAHNLPSEDSNDDIAGLSITSLTFANGTISGTQPLSLTSIALSTSSCCGYAFISIPRLTMTGSAASSITTQGSSLEIHSSVDGNNGVQLGSCSTGDIALFGSDTNSGGTTITNCLVYVEPATQYSGFTVGSGGDLQGIGNVASLTVQPAGKLSPWVGAGLSAGSCALDGDFEIQMLYPRYYASISCSGQVTLGGDIGMAPNYLYLGVVPR